MTVPIDVPQHLSQIQSHCACSSLFRDKAFPMQTCDTMQSEGTRAERSLPQPFCLSVVLLTCSNAQAWARTTLLATCLLACPPHHSVRHDSIQPHSCAGVVQAILISAAPGDTSCTHVCEHVKLQNYSARSRDGLHEHEHAVKAQSGTMQRSVLA